LPAGTLLPMPVAHGEGRFVSGRRGALAKLSEAGQVPLRYARADGAPAEDFPDNPNGAELSAAGVCNAPGNVLALMPHPERVLDLGAIARSVGGEWGRRQREALERGGGTLLEDSPGMSLFDGLRAHLERA
jgi:phosphoribosylformylglycinamidine (FGAM) synthase-like amidotransferase family enzyme